jgi:hypothetical protein
VCSSDLDFDWENRTARRFAPDRENLIDSVLRSALPTGIKPTIFQGKPRALVDIAKRQSMQSLCSNIEKELRPNQTAGRQD